jgi:hypothetical protein
MGRFSRFMPPMPQREPSFVGGLVLAAPGLGFGFVLVRYPRVTGPLVVALAAVTVALNARHGKRLTRLADARRGEDIGTFARALDRRAPEFDPWVVRAVWDALQPHVEVRGRHVPVRPGDRLVADLGIDGEEIEDVAVAAATRAGRNRSDWRANAVNGAVETVGDLLRLVALQPRVAAA